DEGGGNLPRLPDGRAVPLAETLRPFLPRIGHHSRPCSLHPCSFFAARSLYCNTRYVTIPPEGGVSQGGVTMPRKALTAKVSTSIRLTATAKRLLRLLADQRFGGSQAAALEFAIQQTARREKVEAPSAPAPREER